MPLYDVVVWGASGFTGRLVSQYLAGRGVRFAVAGRNAEKLQAVAQLTGAPVLIGDIAHKTTLTTIAEQTKVVLATAGPFINVGTPVVEACIETGTGYVDINGETPWVRDIIDTYHEKARSAGVTVVPNCGFDSIPSDIGTLYAASELHRRTGEKAIEVLGFMKMNGGLSGGTLHTGLTLDRMGFATVRRIADPYLLGGGEGRPRPRDTREARYSEEVKAWTGPFFMAPINTRVVRRSIAARPELFDAQCTYTEVAVAGGEEEAKRMAAPKPSIELREKMVAEGRLPKPGEGPDEARRARSSFTLRILCRGKSKSLWAEVQGGDPGYTETARMVSEAALLLGKGGAAPGVVTPAMAFGESLVDALNAGRPDPMVRILD